MSDHITDSEGQGRPRIDSKGYLANNGARVVGLERDIMNWEHQTMPSIRKQNVMHPPGESLNNNNLSNMLHLPSCYVQVIEFMQLVNEPLNRNFYQSIWKVHFTSGNIL